MRLDLRHWAVLTVLDDGAPLPGNLAGYEHLWRGHDRRFPVTLTWTRSDAAPAGYVVVLPEDAPPFDPADPGRTSLDGALLAETFTHRCFACHGQFDVLYADHAVPMPGDWRARQHPVVSGCPSCGADVATSRLTGLAIHPTS